jgi:hypothetical protein
VKESYADRVLGIFKNILAPSRQLTPEGAELIDLLDDPEGWRVFLPRVGKSSFKSEFSKFHADFWNWYWHLTYLRKKGLPITQEKLTFIAAWGRGNAKSTVVEWASLIEGMMGLDGYVLYVSLTQASAESHVAAIRKRLESSDISYYFPDMANPAMGRHKNRFGWRQNFLQTESGWSIRPLGLDTAVRGLKEEDLRPSIIIFDDIDGYKMSPDVVQANLDTIARDILPAGTSNTIQLVANNLIGEHTATNRIINGLETTVMADHEPSVYPAFEKIEVEKVIDRQSGEPAYVITECVPIWKQFDQEAARVNLNKLGLEAFMAEYQHDFSLDKSDKVIPEYDEKIHVITWSQFMTMFPDTPLMGYVPQHWQVGVGLDVGFTDTHISGWSWLAMSAEDSRLPFCHFRYRVKTYIGESMNEQAQDVQGIINYTDPKTGQIWKESNQYATMKMSHEALNERKVLQREYEMLFGIAKFGKEDGIPQWRSLLRVDKRLPHPFHKDTLDAATGFWKLGRPNFFDVIWDDDVNAPKSRGDMAIAIYQIKNWQRVRPKLTSTGQQDAKPMKWEDDVNDSTRMVLAEQTLHATPLSATQRKLNALRSVAGTDDLSKIQITMGAEDYQGQLMRARMYWREIEMRQEEEARKGAGVLAGLIKPPL